MCRAHWYALPFEIRERILATFRPGQTALTASPEYLEALRDALHYARRAAGRRRPGGPAMSMRIRTLAAGTVLSLAAVAAIASQDPGRRRSRACRPGDPLASYRALAAAPTGNGLELFALVAFIFAACIFVAGWRHARRPDPGRER